MEWRCNPKRPDDACYLKVICEKKNNEKVVGVHILGPNAGEMVQGIGIAVKAGCTKEHFDDCVGIHPTNAEEFTTLTQVKMEGVELSTGGNC